MSVMARPRRITDEIRSEMVRLHLAEEMNLSEIADQYGVSREAVRLVVKASGSRTLTRDRQKAISGTRRLMRAVAVAARLQERSERDYCGTRYGYMRGCTCERCMAANRDYTRGLKGNAAPNHGVSGYMNYGCRCDVCKQAHSDWLWLRRPFGFRKKARA